MTHPPKTDFEWTAFFEKTPDLVCIAGKDGYFRKINPAVIHKLGYTKAELFARPIASFIHPEDRELTASRREALLNGTPLINFQNRYVTKKDGIIWLHWTSIYFPDQEVVFAIAKDVTERKEKELRIEERYRKFKSLATHFKNSMESDRKYLAVELHEELAQLATVLKMDIDCLSHDLAALPDSVKSRMEHATAVTQLLINTIRRISFSISPNMLDDVGLNEALKWLCNEFAVLNGIPCLVESSYNEAVLPLEVKLDLFRICQQSLNNFMNHKEATEINICIKSAGDSLSIYISDNSKCSNAPGKDHTPGWESLQERAASLGGKATIQSLPGKGTKVCVEIPLSLEEKD